MHIVFDGDLNRDTLEGSWVERQRGTRTNVRNDSPYMTMPTTLCKAFKLIGELDGKQEELLNVTNNRKRAYHLELNKEYDKLTLIPVSDWGENKQITVASFDFC